MQPSRTLDFWRSSGWHFLERREDGRHAPSDAFLRAYLLRPELAPGENGLAIHVKPM